jgi:hypothetical protein
MFIVDEGPCCAARTLPTCCERLPRSISYGEMSWTRVMYDSRKKTLYVWNKKPMKYLSSVLVFVLHVLSTMAVHTSTIHNSQTNNFRF